MSMLYLKSDSKHATIWTYAMIWTFFGHIFLTIFAQNPAKNLEELLELQRSIVDITQFGCNRGL
jgi:hypothetical protein